MSLRHLAPVETRHLDLDDPATTLARRRVIRRKRFLERLYREWYARLIARLPEPRSRPVLEIGSGGGFLEEVLDGVITSEVRPLPGLHLAADGLDLPIADAALDGIVLVDVLHHLPRVEAFLAEAERCLAPGGVVAMIEPWVTPFSGLVFRTLHHEPFEPDAPTWGFPPAGPLSGANQALPWIVFARDRARLAEVAPGLEVVAVEPGYPVSYLASGGLSVSWGAPGFLFRAVRALERPFARWAAMVALIVLRRRR